MDLTMDPSLFPLDEGDTYTWTHRTPRTRTQVHDQAQVRDFTLYSYSRSLFHSHTAFHPSLTRLLSGDLAVRTSELQALREEVALRGRIDTRLVNAGVKAFSSPVVITKKGLQGNQGATEEEEQVVRQLVGQLEDLRMRLEALVC